MILHLYLGDATGMKQLFVHVSADNTIAQNLYKKTGFQVWLVGKVFPYILFQLSASPCQPLWEHEYIANGDISLIRLLMLHRLHHWKMKGFWCQWSCEEPLRGGYYEDGLYDHPKHNILCPHSHFEAYAVNTVQCFACKNVTSRWPERGKKMAWACQNGWCLPSMFRAGTTLLSIKI